MASFGQKPFHSCRDLTCSQVYWQNSFHTAKFQTYIIQNTLCTIISIFLKIKLHNAFKHNTTIIQEIIVSIKFLDNVNQISEIQACMVINMIYFLCI